MERPEVERLKGQASKLERRVESFRTKQKKHCCGGLNLMYFTSSLVAWLLFEFESELSLSHHPSTRFETTFRISDHLAEKTTFFELKNSLRIVSKYLITYLIQKLAIGHVFLSEALFWL